MPAVIRQGKVIASCDVCGKMAHNGFGKMWACDEHLKQVEAQWLAADAGDSGAGSGSGAQGG